MAWWHRVGQRVKIVRDGISGNVNVGREGTIEFIGHPEGWHHTYDCFVAWDVPVFMLAPQLIQSSGIELHRLEPIMPEGNKVVSWEDCLWNPSHLTEEQLT